MQHLGLTCAGVRSSGQASPEDLKQTIISVPTGHRASSSFLVNSINIHWDGAPQFSDSGNCNGCFRYLKTAIRSRCAPVVLDLAKPECPSSQVCSISFVSFVTVAVRSIGSGEHAVMTVVGWRLAGTRV